MRRLLLLSLLAACSAYAPLCAAPPRPLLAPLRQPPPVASAAAERQPPRWRSPLRAPRALLPRLLPALLAPPLLLRRALAMGGGGAAAAGPVVPMDGSTLLLRLVLWAGLFTTAALLAGAETALTTLWPWKIKQLAADEGPDSPFAALQDDLTGVLTSLLVAVTFCMVYGTAIATEIALSLWGTSGIGYATVALTMVTLIFGEVLPKSLAVANAEALCRFTLPLIRACRLLFRPVAAVMAVVNSVVLSAAGVEEGDAEQVSQPELRLMIEGSKESGAVEDYEGEMIEGVLDLEKTKVDQILQPRVDLVAVEAKSSLAELLEKARGEKYSRIPVYNETVDHIIGIVFTRDLIEYTDRPASELKEAKVEGLMEDTAFIPETMTAMNALKLMRRQRLHMLVVVDEFGGTSGVVTLEDILETLVGEIYDEDDDEEVVEDMLEIKENDDGSYDIEGGADLEGVCAVLGLDLKEEQEEFATIAGYLCSQAGEIPAAGQVVLVSEGENGDTKTRLRFEVLDADERRLKLVRASNMTASDLLVVAAREEGMEEKDRMRGD